MKEEIIQTVKVGDTYRAVRIRREVRDVQPIPVAQPSISPMDDFLVGVEHGVSLVQKMKQVFKQLKRL